MSHPPSRPGADGPVDEVGVDLGPDEARGLLDGWTATGGDTGDRTGERTGTVGTDPDAAHARIAALTEAATLLRRTLLPAEGAGADWLQRVAPDPLPLADGLPPPALPAAPAGGGEVTAVAPHPFWGREGLEPEGRPTDSGFVDLDDRTDTLGGPGRTHPGVEPTPPRGVPTGFADPTERTQTQVTLPAAPAAGPPAWWLSVLGALVVILGGIVALLLLGS